MSGHTPGPWGWFGNEYGFYLATPDRGRQHVMGFTRMGMRGAQPTFQQNHRMVKAQELVRFEVDRTVKGMEAGKAAESVYRYDIIDIDHPDARLIASAPETAAELERAQETIADLLSAVRDARTHICQQIDAHPGVTPANLIANSVVAEIDRAISRATPDTGADHGD